MFDVGFWELVLIFGLGLVILGPERLPRIAAQVGRWVGRARRTASQLRRQLEMEIRLDEPPTYPRSKPPPPTSTPASENIEQPDSGEGADHAPDVEAIEEDETAAEANPDEAKAAETHGKD